MSIKKLHHLVLGDLKLLATANVRQHTALTKWLKNDVQDWLVDKMSDQDLMLNLIAIEQACNAHLVAFWGSSPNQPPDVEAYFNSYSQRKLL